VVLISDNFVLDLKLASDIVSLEPMLKAAVTTWDKFLDDFWPAVHANAIVEGEFWPSRSRTRPAR
jgi:sn-glycerol 3-phosphate transport system substrate-binding protein